MFLIIIIIIIIIIVILIYAFNYILAFSSEACQMLSICLTRLQPLSPLGTVRYIRESGERIIILNLTKCLIVFA